MKRRNVHTKTIIYMAMLFSVIPLTVMVLILFSYTLRQNHERELGIIQNAQNTIAKSVSNDKATVEAAADLCSHQMDYLIFCTSSDRKKLYLSGSDIISYLKEKYRFHPSITAIFLYNDTCSYMYPYFFYNAPGELRTYAATQLEPSENKGGCWSAKLVEDEPFLFYQIQSDHGLLTVVLNPNRNYDYRNIISTDSLSLRLVQTDDVSAKDRRAQVITEIPDVPLSIIYDGLGNGIFSNIDLFQIIMLILIVLFILMIPVLWYFVQRLLLTPITQLQELFNQIRASNLDSRVPVDSPVIELRSFAASFNEMLDNIDALNKEIYKQKLDVSRARLQFLQLQIRPHFYLNCLKNMYAHLNMKRYDKIEEMIPALSAYFAQSFRDIQNFVSLKDELDTCESYIQLQNVLERDITLNVDIDYPCVNARCLPMTVVTFVENCIKHSHNGQNLEIIISARKMDAAAVREHAGTVQEDAAAVQEQAAAPTMIITIRNNGAFSPEALTALNEADPSEMVYKHEKIGISNVRYRLWLIYRDSARVTFRNEDGQAVVEIQMPFESM